MIRWAEARDVADLLAQIQYRAVREGRSLYSEVQRFAWVAAPCPPQKLAERLGTARAVLYVRSGEEVGCMTLAKGGYIDMAFVLPAHQGSGVFRALCGALEQEAHRGGETRLSTHASLMAQPAFRALGFSVIQHETVVRAGVELPRAEMEKWLG